MSSRQKSKSIKDPFDKYPLIARRLRSVRIDHQMTQDELGEMFGITGQAVSNYENGKVLPSIPSLMKYHEYFGTDLNYLMGDDSAEQVSSDFIMSSTEMQLVKGYRRRPEYIQKAVRTICYNGTSFRNLDDEIRDLEDYIADLKKQKEKS